MQQVSTAKASTFKTGRWSPVLRLMVPEPGPREAVSRRVAAVIALNARIATRRSRGWYPRHRRVDGRRVLGSTPLGGQITPWDSESRSPRKGVAPGGGGAVSSPGIWTGDEPIAYPLALRPRGRKWTSLKGCAAGPGVGAREGASPDYPLLLDVDDQRQCKARRR
jgi:hypothetical protein